MLLKNTMTSKYYCALKIRKKENVDKIKFSAEYIFQNNNNNNNNIFKLVQ